MVHAKAFASAVTMRYHLKSFALAACIALSACSTLPPAPAVVPDFLFADPLFGAPSEQVGAQQVFAVSDEMRRYARTEMAALIRKHGAQGALVEALYRNGQLKLEYESTLTRNAAQAFDARAGNCLSLVIMTAAFARELGMQVRYQSAYLEEAWSRKGSLLMRSGHVNVTLGRRLADHGVNAIPHDLTIDFLPPEELRNLRTVEVPESLVVAMFMNNRAVEALVQDRFDDAYAWSREAIRTEPSFLAAQNTLGVIYLRRGALSEASAAFSHVLDRDARHTRALANLIEVMSRQGRQTEADRLRVRLVQLEPEPPLHFFNQGMAAMERNDFRAARDSFAREASRGDPPAEIHYWLGLAHYRLGNIEQAGRELERAADASASRAERERYSAKLDWLRARGAR
jgi:tetratricopeptide (TPR) repeat protein